VVLILKLLGILRLDATMGRRPKIFGGMVQIIGFGSGMLLKMGT